MTTIRQFVPETCAAIYQVLKEKYLKVYMYLLFLFFSSSTFIVQFVHIQTVKYDKMTTSYQTTFCFNSIVFQCPDTVEEWQQVAIGFQAQTLAYSRPLCHTQPTVQYTPNSSGINCASTLIQTLVQCPFSGAKYKHVTNLFVSSL